MIYDRVVKLDSLAPIYLSYSHNPNTAYLDQWVKSSIRRGYVDPCGTQIRLIFPIFEYSGLLREKFPESSILWEQSHEFFFWVPINSFNHFRVRPWKFFFLSFLFCQAQAQVQAETSTRSPSTTPREIRHASINWLYLSMLPAPTYLHCNTLKVSRC